VLCRGQGIPDDTGRIARVVGTDLDVTDLRRADAERRRLLGRLYHLQEGEDRTLAADLHDGHVQGLAALGLRLEQARLRLGAAGEPEVHALLWQVAEDLSAEIASLRRTIGRLRPFVLDQQGLEAALREEAALARARAPLLACQVTAELGGQRLDPATETALFRVAQQALANVTDHARARCASVDLCRTGDGVVLCVADDGQGFEPEHVRVLGEVHSFGLIAMRERVEALGGRLSVATTPGRGTRVEAWVPAARAAAEGGPA
jgi:signal transduction histidine kinase